MRIARSSNAARSYSSKQGNDQNTEQKPQQDKQPKKSVKEIDDEMLSKLKDRDTGQEEIEEGEVAGCVRAACTKIFFRQYRWWIEASCTRAKVQIDLKYPRLSITFACELYALSQTTMSAAATRRYEDDERWNDLESSLHNIHSQSLLIHQESSEQNTLLENLSEFIDKIDNKMGGARKYFDKLSVTSECHLHSLAAISSLTHSRR